MDDDNVFTMEDLECANCVTSVALIRATMTRGLLLRKVM